MKVKRKYIAVLIFILVSGLNYLTGQNPPSPYRIEKLPISTNGSNEMAPVLVKDGIIFCSDRKISSIINHTDFNDDRLYNIFLAVRTDSLWGRPQRIKDPASHLAQYGSACIAPDGKTIYFTRSVLSGRAAKRRTTQNPLGIFVGELSGTDIINVKPFEYNDPKYKFDCRYPFISSDGKYLFFASNMPGGQGASDLYYCENIGGKWSKPMNLGPKVNTASLENYPFMHPSGRLYFSSDRPSSASYMGNMDVYYTSLINGTWDTPVALPEPINSKEDDYAFVAEENLQTGYFTRNSNPTTDIWIFKSTIIRKTVCDSILSDSYCYEFEEANASRFDSVSFKYKYIWNFSDGGRETGVKIIHCFPGPGQYKVVVDIENLVTRELKKAEKTYDMNLTPVEQPYISSPLDCQEGELISLNADSTYLPGWNITQFYWNFGDESFATGKQVSHKFIKAGEYSVQLIVTSAPDANGVPKEACVSKNIRVKRIP
jgi:PKD repeat protein